MEFCPFCGWNNVAVQWMTVCFACNKSCLNNFPGWQCICRDCRTTGPLKEDPKDAIVAWNAIPRKLRWTDERPKQEGCYWCRLKGGRSCYLFSVSPYDEINNKLCAKLSYPKVGILCKEFVDSEFFNAFEWAGPIPTPEV